MKLRLPRYRFTLRALLVVTTLLAVALGVIVYRAERQRKAVAWVKEHQGGVLYAHQKITIPKKPDVLPVPRWLVDALGEHYFFTTKYVGIYGLTAETDLSALGDLPSLKQLSLSGGHITAAHLRQLGALPALTEFSISKCNIDDDALREIRDWPQVDQLILSKMRLNSPVTSSAFGLPNLRALLYNNCEVDMSGVGSCEDLQNLEELALRDVPGMGRDFSQLAPLPKLRTFEITTGWTPATYASIGRQPALKLVEIEGGELDLATLNQVCDIPTLKNLYLECDYGRDVAERIQGLPPQLKVVTRPARKDKPKFNFDTGEWEQPTAAP